jgi:hypothetical protein
MSFLRKFRMWALVIGLGSVVTGALAQPLSAESPQPARLRFLFIDETPGVYSIKPAQEHIQISAHPYEVSAPFTPEDAKPLAVYKALPDPVTGVLKPVRIASITPPPRITSALVIITPRPAATPDVAPVYESEIINSDPVTFPAGTLRIINRSTVPMAARFSAESVITQPNEISLLRPATDAYHRSFFKIAIQVQNSAGGWRLIQNSITVIPPTQRMVGILVFSPGGMRHMLTPAELAEFGPPKPKHFWLTYSETP